ncbi:hypothetical protein A3780_20425 [Kosakonia radicincitans]|uniref:DotU family type IV/VI secretion system protein n=1 Tax=Kosakonia radicincitans TaxID=283686 RepID=UPI000903D53A|nr:DotU family type IV/VI secretion system protein [Kosakonia radicincitans]APG19812.1 hypothetical protein A3780_20425 [Kosakonia radicincitans]
MHKFRLVEYFIPLMSYIQFFRANPSTSAEQLAGIIEKYVQSARQKALDSNLSEDFDNALFAVIAWIDEVVLGTEWSEVEEWKNNHLLQLKIYHTVTAGETFYRKLHALDDDNFYVKAVYIYCLYLGFTGKFGFHDQHGELEKLKKENILTFLSNPEKPGFNPESKLFPFSYRKDRIVHKRKYSYWGRWFNIGLWKSIALTSIPPVLLIFISYFYLWRASLSDF